MSVKVRGHSNLIKRDAAVITTDWKIYEAAKKRRAEKERIDNLENKINRIESLLEKVVEKNG